MSDDSVFLVLELWINPESFNELKIFKRKVNKILDNYSPKYVHHSHAIEWTTDGNSEKLPTGIEVIEFKNMDIARKAINDLDTKELKDMENKIFSRIRSYISKHDFPEEMINEIGL